MPSSIKSRHFSTFAVDPADDVQEMVSLVDNTVGFDNIALSPSCTTILAGSTYSDDTYTWEWVTDQSISFSSPFGWLYVRNAGIAVVDPATPTHQLGNGYYTDFGSVKYKAVGPPGMGLYFYTEALSGTTNRRFVPASFNQRFSQGVMGNILDFTRVFEDTSIYPLPLDYAVDLTHESGLMLVQVRLGKCIDGFQDPVTGWFDVEFNCNLNTMRKSVRLRNPTLSQLDVSYVSFILMAPLEVRVRARNFDLQTEAEPLLESVEVKYWRL